MYSFTGIYGLKNIWPYLLLIEVIFYKNMLTLHFCVKKMKVSFIKLFDVI